MKIAEPRAAVDRALAAFVLVVLVGLAACRPGSPPPTLAVEPAFPIVIVLVDALRADRVNSQGQASLAPNLAKLAGDSVVFRNAFVSAPKTIPSVPQIFTSHYFPDHHHDVTLLSVARDAGYERTGAFIHNPYVTKWLGRIEPTFDDLGGGEFDAIRLTDQATDWIARRPSDRIALYVHYLDVHTPYRPPLEYASRFVDPAYTGPIGLEFGDTSGAWAGRYGEKDQERIRHLYDATVAATDAQVGRLVDALKQAGLYDRALVVVTADHGEELWDRGGFFHGHSLYDELLHVPLVVKFPGSFAAGTRVEALARTVDILPTIQDLLARVAGGKKPEASQAPASALDGLSLLPLVEDRDAPARTLFATVGRVDGRSPPLHAVRTLESKLIADVRSGEEQLFDLVRDPGERVNLARDPAARERLDGMRRQLESALVTLADTGVHVRLANGGASAVTYRIAIGLKPLAPFVNLARFGMEEGDRIEARPRADGMIVEGTLEPGDTDEARFEALAGQAAVTASVTVEEKPKDAAKAASRAPAVELCVADEAGCSGEAVSAVELEFRRLETASAPPPRRAAGVQLHWWMVPGQSAPIAPALSPADRERLRALGYAE